MQILITFSTTTVLFFSFLLIFILFYRARHKLQDASSVSRNETHTSAQNPSLFFSYSFFCPSFLLYFIIPNFSHFLSISISTIVSSLYCVHYQRLYNIRFIYLWMYVTTEQRTLLTAVYHSL
jgi:hypothetical protein